MSSLKYWIDTKIGLCGKVISSIFEAEFFQKIENCIFNLLSKVHYCYKILTLLIKSSAYRPSIDNPLHGLHLPLPPPFLQENLACYPTSMIFQKPQPPPYK